MQFSSPNAFLTNPQTLPGILTLHARQQHPSCNSVLLGSWKGVGQQKVRASGDSLQVSIPLSSLIILFPGDTTFLHHHFSGCTYALLLPCHHQKQWESLLQLAPAQPKEGISPHNQQEYNAPPICANLTEPTGKRQNNPSQPS